MIVVTHNHMLIEALSGAPDANPLRLEKSFGETGIAGLSSLARPPWHWPDR
jgi:predicted ATPase